MADLGGTRTGDQFIDDALILGFFEVLDPIGRSLGIVDFTVQPRKID